MANFRYQVIDSNGKMSEGIVEATSIGEASRKLKSDGKYIASLSCYHLQTACFTFVCRYYRSKITRYALSAA